MSLSSLANLLKISRFSRSLIRTLPYSHIAKTVSGYTSLGLALSQCEAQKAPKENAKPEVLTREACIKQACLMSINAATTLLTTTSSALLDIAVEYKNSLNTILTLLEEIQVSEGENSHLWDAVVEARSAVNEAKAALNELSLYMATVQKVVNSTTEAAFMAGSEFMCTSMCERLYSAQKEIEQELAELKKMEEDYMRLQEEIVRDKNQAGKKKIQNTSGSQSEKNRVLNV